MVETRATFGVDKVVRGPIFVVETTPDLIFVVDRNRVFNLQGRYRGAHVVDIAFEGKLWRVHTDYDQSEQEIQQLLEEAGNGNVPQSLVTVNASGVEAAANVNDDQSPETYIGYDRADNFVSPGGIVENESHVYALPSLRLNDWSLSGDWTVRAENAVLNGVGGSIVYRFHARDLHLVLGPAADGAPIRFRVTIDGKAPGVDHGTDTDADGQGIVDSQRLYQLVRQSGVIRDRTFAIEFLDPGVHAYAFTFG